MIRSRIFVLAAAVLLSATAANAQEVVSAPETSSARGSIGMNYSLDPNFVIRSDAPVGRPAKHPTISRVYDGGAAARAGLRVGDVILSVNGRDARERNIFPGGRTPGTRFVLRIRRDDEEREVILVVLPRRGA